jgi:hypothetical protein
MKRLISLQFFFLGVGWDWVHLVRRPLTGLLYQPRIIDDECGAVGGMRIGRGNRSTRIKPAPVPLCPPVYTLQYYTPTKAYVFQPVSSIQVSLPKLHIHLSGPLNCYMQRIPHPFRFHDSIYTGRGVQTMKPFFIKFPPEIIVLPHFSFQTFSSSNMLSNTQFTPYCKRLHNKVICILNCLKIEIITKHIH